MRVEHILSRGPLSRRPVRILVMARLFRYGRLIHQGGFFNAGTSQMTALPVDPDRWRRIRKRCGHRKYQRS
jgi:hypothetical protein